MDAQDLSGYSPRRYQYEAAATYLNGMVYGFAVQISHSLLDFTYISIDLISP
jgi:hypothetical protein